MNINNERAPAKPIKTTTLIAMVVYGILYLASESNLDRFNLQEGAEYITNDHVDSKPLNIAGFSTSLLSNIPILLTVLYFWMLSITHGGTPSDCDSSDDDNHHQHDEEDNHALVSHHEHSEESHNHEHTLLHELGDAVIIGVPFALMGVAAYLETLEDLVKVKELTLLQKILAYAGAGVSGSITGYGAYILHGFHTHAGMMENGGGVKGFLNSYKTTFITNVWNVHNEHDNFVIKVLAVVNEFWKKIGIVAVHGFLGSYAADVFLQETGLDDAPAFAWILKIILPIAIMLFEGNTEARSLDAYRRKQHAYSFFSKLVVAFSGFLHTIPSITACAEMIKNSTPGHHEDHTSQALVDSSFPAINKERLIIYLAATAVLAYPSTYGFYATTINSYDKAAQRASSKISSGLTSLINKFGFRNAERLERQPQPNYLTFGSGDRNQPHP